MSPENPFLTRVEYEARHTALQTQVMQMEARLSSEQASIRAEIDRKFDRLLDEFRGLRKDLVARDALETLKVRIDNNVGDITELKQSHISARELLALRMAGIGALLAFLVALIDLMLRLKFTP